MPTYPQKVFKLIENKGPMTIREVLPLIVRNTPNVTDAGIRTTLYAHARRRDSLFNINGGLIIMNQRWV